MKKINISTKKYPNMFAIVDDEDYERLNKFKWAPAFSNTWNKFSSITRTEKKQSIKKSILIHREIMGAKKGQIVDHINHNILDNRKENLRICSVSDNARNQIKRIGCSSKYKGIYWQKQIKRWHAQIGYTENNKVKQIYLGTFKNPADAAKAYDIKAQELFGEFACINK